MTYQTPPSSGPDTLPAYTGFIIGAIALFVVLFGIVKLTSSHLEKRDAAAPAAATTPAPPQ